jgi:hypothetical protein
MSRFNLWKLGTSGFMLVMLTASAITPLVINNRPALAQSIFKNGQNNNNRIVISQGTTLPVKYDEAEKILVTKEETAPLTVTVAANIVNRNGTILIPYNSEIVGEIKPHPTEEGSYFVAQTLIIDDTEYKIEGSSEPVTRIETVKKGASTKNILTGTAVGAAAATVIAGVTGDRAIATEEILGGAALGTLGGWLLGRKSVDLIAIYPNEGDLDIILDADLVLN